MQYSLKKLSLFVCGIALVMASGLTSCEQIVANATLPHEEKIVIEGLLRAGQPLDSILITRVQPPLERASTDKAYLQGAEVTIRVDGQNYTPQVRFDTVRLNNFSGPSSGIPQGVLPMYGVPGVRVQAGKTYEITVRWNGKVAQAKAAVPSAESSLLGQNYTTTVKTDSVSVPVGYSRSPTGSYIQEFISIPTLNITLNADVRLRPGLLHQLLIYARDTASFRNGRVDSTIVFFGGRTIATSGGGENFSASILLPKDAAERTVGMQVSGWRSVEYTTTYTNPTATNPQGRTEVVVRGTIGQIQEHLRRARWYAAVVMTESSYYDWVNSSSQAQYGSGNSGPFSAGGTNPVWNVTGDGIGVFAGTSGIERPIQVRW